MHKNLHAGFYVCKNAQELWQGGFIFLKCTRIDMQDFMFIKMHKNCDEQDFIFVKVHAE